MKLFFIAHRIYKPTTGGELLSEAFLEGAEKSGLEVIRIEGQIYKKLVKKILIMNFILLYKVLFIKKHDVLLLDTDFHARYILALLWAKYFRKVPIYGLLYHYNFLDKESKLHKTIHYHIESFVSKHFNGLITIGNFSLQTFYAITKSKQVDIHIVQPFSKNSEIGSCRVKFDEKVIHLIQVGTIEPRKNVLTILKSLTQVNIPFHIDFVGKSYGDEYFRLCNDFVNRNNLNEKVVFHGKVSNEMLQRLYSCNSVFILVSRLEGYGMAYAESMQYGLPIIGSKTGAVPDLVEDGVNGFLCDPQDEDGIAKAITTLTNKAIWQKISEANYLKANNFLSRAEFVDKSTDVFTLLQSRLLKDRSI